MNLTTMGKYTQKKQLHILPKREREHHVQGEESCCHSQDMFVIYKFLFVSKAYVNPSDHPTNPCLYNRQEPRRDIPGRKGQGSCPMEQTNAYSRSG